MIVVKTRMRGIPDTCSKCSYYRSRGASHWDLPTCGAVGGYGIYGKQIEGMVCQTKMYWCPLVEVEKGGGTPMPSPVTRLRHVYKPRGRTEAYCPTCGGWAEMKLHCCQCGARLLYKYLFKADGSLKDEYAHCLEGWTPEWARIPHKNENGENADLCGSEWNDDEEGVRCP